MSQTDIEITGDAEKVAEAPKREGFQSLSVTLRLPEDANPLESLAAIAELGDVQQVSIFKQQSYVDGPAFY